MALRFKVKDTRKLETTLRGGSKRVSDALFQVVKDDAHKFAKGLINSVEQDSRFNELRTSDDLRGVLGMPKPAFRQGADTDAEDLIRILKTYEVIGTRNARYKTVRIVFPTLQQLEEKLTRSLSTIQKGVAIPGPQQSWFRWWEFGDRGEITSLTVMRRTIARIARGQSNKSKSRSKLARIISERSRSGSAIQLPNIPAGPGGGVQGRSLIQDKYRNFAKIYPARAGRLVKTWARNNQSLIGRLFSRARIA